MNRNVRIPHVAVDLSDRRVISWRLLAAVLAVEVVLSAAFNLVVFRSEWFLETVFRPVFVATGGLVGPTLLVNAVNVLLVLVGLLILVGGLRLRDLGLERSKLPLAAAVTAGLWATIQVVGATVAYVQTGSVALDPLWSTAGVGAVLGLLVAQLFGNALFEEVLYRAVLLDQLVLKLRHRRRGFLLALVGSQAVFSLLHVPNRLYQGFPLDALLVSLGMLFLMGLLFALVYHRTGNLLVAVGVHAVGNAPTMLVETPVSGNFLTVVLAVVLVVVWPVVSGSRGSGPQSSDEVRPTA
ncbi:CPBP family intramembrane glutamic endopeptidase [Halogeometricum sp. CBA1124]|uniref:CPBP family intramembrane glutamic endopeptidase n=1 Tax=Halogeometricum sp. CBA1124 TaxID=2668071 RepID=UPI00142B2E14|nr:CPBP family intramembrane glutamic endopeptidase [Halogeometricum sp. CBA1124]MUV56458.1 CPBP family intramembrane metalloprotease [Halogeometricum sp. CBA1124]